MYIKKIQLKNIKCFEDVALSFRIVETTTAGGRYC